MKVCNMDCFNCVYDDCINDKVRPLEIRTKDQKEKRNKCERERYYNRKEQGLCVRCGKEAVHGIFCNEHWIESTRRNRARTKPLIREHRKAHGLCYFCGDERVPGKKVCEKHLKTLVKNAAYAGQFVERSCVWSY